MTIKEFFTIPSVRFGVHMILILGVMINVYQLYRLDRIQKDLIKETSILSLLTQENSDNKNEKDYFGSYLFKETYAKENSNFKVRGETVIDTSLSEPDSNPKQATVYRPVETKKVKPNWQKWWDMFFLPGVDN